MLDPMVPSRCKLYNLRNRTLMFNQQGKVCAQIFAPQGTVRLRQDDQLFGNLVADDLQIDQGGALHWDGLAGTSACGIPLLDKAGVNGATGNGQVTSSATFAEWFTDVLGENQSKLHSIDLVDNGTGIYEYLGGQFYPVDGDLLGNEGAAHNENFTFTFTASFKYEACIGQFLTVEGGDGLWVFINGALVIDLGGVDYAMDEYIDVDRLGLSDQQVYEMRVFYASRNSSGSVLNLRTNIPLIYVPSTVTITGTGD
jgi:fibro-slime domain-containing protein